MFCNKLKAELNELQAQLRDQNNLLDALHKVSAIIEFDMNGIILDANQNFLDAVGYQLSEIKGKHHQIFLPEKEHQSAEYKAFWENLNRGEFISRRFKRCKKTGGELWLEASYNPILDAQDNPYKVVKFATDITDQVLHNLEADGQVDAINKVMAVIQFDPQGNILSANENFLKTMDYSFAEIQGQHHQKFVSADYAKSPEYQAFWEQLRNGQYQTGTFQRFDKNGNQVWLEASYNPIIDSYGKVLKIIKYANDIGSNKNSLLLESVIKDASEVIQKIANGDLTAKMHNHIDSNTQTLYDKQIIQLTSAITDMDERLKSVIKVAINATISVKASSDEVGNSAHHLNQSIQEQTTALLETSQTMHHVNEAIQNNTQNAQNASAVALQVQEKTGESVYVMGQTIEAMNQIQASSHKISDIVSLIDGIAFQTNLLALNAAVEAARAGEHGRGFAVVAGEVRNLAQKSAEAAKDIKHLIDETVSRVSHGSTLATQSGEVLQGISDSIGSMTQMIAEIASLSKEQAHGVSEVGIAISQIDQVSQQNAVLIAETSEAAISMAEQSDILSENMAFFNTGTNHQLPAPSDN